MGDVETARFEIGKRKYSNGILARKAGGESIPEGGCSLTNARLFYRLIGDGRRGLIQTTRIDDYADIFRRSGYPPYTPSAPVGYWHN